MTSQEHAFLLKLNILIDRGKVQDALHYIKTHDITPSLYRNEATAPRLSPLSLAADRGHLDLVKLLIQQGFDPHELEYYSSDIEEWKPIHYACCHGHVDIVRYFIEEHNVDVESLTGLKWSMLQHAVNYSHPEMVKYLVETGASINNHEGDYHPLRLAVSCHNNQDICEYLLSNGANVNVRDTDGFTPLLVAVTEEREDIVKLLLSAGASTEIVTIGGNTPLTAAIRHGNLALVKLLISEGADPEWVGSDGRSVLHKALRQDRNYEFDIVFYLVVDTGVCVHTTDKKGHSPLYAAVQANHLDAAELLVNCGFDMKCERWVFDEVVFVDVNPEQRDVLLKLQEIVSNPISLKDGCCELIRQVMGRPLPHSVELLPLPQSIKDYILMKHKMTSSGPGPTVAKMTVNEF